MTHKINIYHGGFGNCPEEYVQPHIEWCLDNINGIWSVDPPYTNKTYEGMEIILHYTFVFREEEDAMAFKLRWL